MSARFTHDELRQVLGTGGDARAGELAYGSVSTDTRTLSEGALFVALEGERFDAMDFLEDAAEAGARGAVVRAGEDLPDLPLRYYPVPDTLEALGRLAAHHRRRAGRRVVGVTGSSGKTTVKEMLADAAGGALEAYRSEGNLNNQVGLPLALLRAPEDADVWIVELGTNAPGEIGRLTAIADPDDAVVTTVGPAHLEGLGDVEGVLREKMALVEGARRSGFVVVGERPAELPSAARERRPDTLVAGLSERADYRPDHWEVGPDRVEFHRDDVVYRVAAGGEHHLRDAVMAAAAAEALGVAPAAVAEGLARFRPLAMRGALRQAGALTVVDDCYNANPESFEAAVHYCVETFPERVKVAVVGSMLELGERSASLHRSVASRILESGFELVGATGEFVPAFEELSGREGGPGTAEVLLAEDVDELWVELAERLRGDEVVLVKASRGGRFERIVERLERRFAADAVGDGGGGCGRWDSGGGRGVSDSNPGGRGDPRPTRETGTVRRAGGPGG